jgi:hypothetical protein
VRDASKAALWLGIVTSVIAVLAFFGIDNFDELQKAARSLSASGSSDSTDARLRDPCEALTSEYINRLGMGTDSAAYAGARFAKEDPNNGSWWSCFWSSSDHRTRLSIGYQQNILHQSQVRGPLAGIPDGQIGPQYAPMPTSCYADWPTSFGQVEVWFSGTCSETKQIAKDVYKKLSR